MTTTPLTAIRNPDGQMYLKEKNPHPNSSIAPNYKTGDCEKWVDFNRTHPPIIALFKCEEGQQFVEGVDVTKVIQGWAGIEWVEIDEDTLRSFLAGTSVIFTDARQAFQLIEQKERGIAESQFDKNRFYTKQLHDCPFCGSKAGEELFMYRAEPDHYLVRCTFCQASMKHDRADKVIGIWNHRGLIKR